MENSFKEKKSAANISYLKLYKYSMLNWIPVQFTMFTFEDFEQNAETRTIFTCENLLNFRNKSAKNQCNGLPAAGGVLHPVVGEGEHAGPATGARSNILNIWISCKIMLLYRLPFKIVLYLHSYNH